MEFGIKNKNNLLFPKGIKEMEFLNMKNIISDYFCYFCGHIIYFS